MKYTGISVNAQLMASAPEMLEALKTTKSWFQNNVESLGSVRGAYEIFDQILFAIAKAERKQNENL